MRKAQRHKGTEAQGEGVPYSFATLCLCLLCAFLFAPFLRAGTAILWIPGEHAPLDDVIARLEADKSLKLSAALGELPAPVAEKIKDLAAKGRIELAARPAGDPIVPLLYYSREDAVRWQNKPSSAAFSNDPFFIALRMSDARDAYARSFKRPPEGFVSAPGGTVAEYIPLAKALGFKWLAAGPSVSTAPFSFIDAEGVSIVPFSLLPAAGEPLVPRLSGCLPDRLSGCTAVSPYFLVFDESSGGPGSRAALLAFLSAGNSSPYMTVSEALRTAVSTAMPAAAAAQFTAPWSGDYTPWAGSPMQSGALTAFARTRGDLMTHLNAKQGDYKAAKAAFTEYFSVESGPKLLKLSDPDPETAGETEIEIQNALGNAYRLMDRTPPGWLFSTLADMKEKTEDADKAAVTKSSYGFILSNASRPPSVPLSQGGPAPVKGQDPYKIWKLSRISVSWTAGDIVFAFAPLAAPGGAADGAFARARFDLYIDMNNRPRAGAARLLNGRTGRIFPDNAWEYALEASARTSALYAATDKGPRKTGSFKTGFEDGSFTVRVPRTALPGNPGRWSYTAFMLYTADDRTFEITDFLADDFSNGYYYAVRPGEK